MKTCWRELLNQAREGESLIACTLSDAELDARFYNGYGGTEGAPFAAWSETYVYFPICYDGAEWVGRAPRNPRDKPCEHQGGG